MYVFYALVAAFMFGMFSTASAQQLTVGAGSKGLTYDRELQEINKFCSSSIALIGVPTNGSVKNMEMLIGNDIQGAWTQADILYMMAKSQDMSNIKTLLVLHKEQLHFVVKAAPVKVGGYNLGMNIGGKEITITELPQIAGMTVAAAGGAVWTARQVRTDSEIQYKILEVNTSQEAVEAVNAGKAQAALIVGGKPVDYLKTLGKDFRILRIPEATQSKIKGVYLPDNVSYMNMTESQGVDTASVQSLFVVREYKTPKMQQALHSLQSCVLDNLDTIKETPKTHPAWQTVKVEDQAKAKWPLYQFPASAKR